MRVALVTNGIASTFHAALELGRRLGEHDAEVAIASHVDLAEGCAANGLDFIHFDAERRAVAEIRARWNDVAGGRPPRPHAVGALIAAVRRGRRDTVSATEIRAWFDAFEPDVVVADTEAHVGIVAAIERGIPVVLTTFLFGIHERPGLPPMSSTSNPDARGLATEWEQLRTRARRAERRRRFSRRGVHDLIAPVSPGTTSATAINAVARALGVDLRDQIDRGSWLRPHGYTRLPVLSCNLWELEFAHEVPDNWHYVGPMVRHDRIDVGLTDEDRTSWTAYRERVRDGSPRSLVYASLGSFWATDVDLLTRIVDAFRDRPEWQLLIGLGGRLDPDALGPTPANVTALRWAPQVEALDLADVAIVHGGNAALNECVLAGVPMLVVSTGHLDQNGIAARVEHHGIGRRVRPDASSDAIAAAIADLVDGTAVRSKISDMGTIAKDEQPMRAAVDLIVTAARRAG